jgi:hypothetical membrane protein
MNKQRLLGIIGIAGVGLCLVLLIIAIITFEDGVYSPLHCFVSELGLYTRGYFTISSALLYNIGTIIAGLVVAFFMLMTGIRKSTWMDASVSFFGILSGILLTAQGIYTLNYAPYHSIVLIAFFISVFVMCALYIISQLAGAGIKNASLATVLVAFVAGCTSAAFAVFEVLGGMGRVFAADASGVGRLSVMPFAIIEWAALILLLAFIVLLAVRALTGRDTKKEPLTIAEPRGIQL